MCLCRLGPAGRDDQTGALIESGGERKEVGALSDQLTVGRDGREVPRARRCPRPNRLVVAGCPHHIIQRGNSRQAIFFDDADRGFFLSVPGEAFEARQGGMDAYVLMTNHVDLLITPEGDAKRRRPHAIAAGFGDRLSCPFPRLCCDLWGARITCPCNSRLKSPVPRGSAIRSRRRSAQRSRRAFGAARARRSWARRRARQRRNDWYEKKGCAINDFDPISRTSECLPRAAPAALRRMHPASRLTRRPRDARRPRRILASWLSHATRQ